MKTKLLLIEDEPDLADNIKSILELNEFDVTTARDGEAGIKLAKQIVPDIIISDILMPNKTGYEVLEELSRDEKTSHIPFIFLTAKVEHKDLRKGMELGADDYVTKPFSPRVLFSRVKAVLRRNAETDKPTQIVYFGEYSLEAEKYLVKKKEKSIPLTLSEFGILRRLVLNRGKVLTRNQLLDDLQSDDAFVVDRNIDVHVAALRKKLGPNFEYIETVRGVGYRFKSDD